MKKRSKRLKALVLSVAVFTGSLTCNVVPSSAQERSWKQEVTEALGEVTGSITAAGTSYEHALESLSAAYESLESAATVKDLKVEELGTDSIVLSWPAMQAGNLVGYNVYWADKNLETTQFLLLGPDGRTAIDTSEVSISVDDIDTASDTVSFVVDKVPFQNYYFKVAPVTTLGVGSKSDAVKSPTAVERDAFLENLGRGLTVVMTQDGAYLNWRLLADEVEGYSETGLTGMNFHVYRNNEKIAEVTDSTNYLDTGNKTQITQGMYKLVLVDSSGKEIASRTCTTYDIFEKDTDNQNVAYKDIPLQIPEDTTFRKTYGITKRAAGDVDEVITYSANDMSVADVDNDGEYEYIVQWTPSYSKDVSQFGYTGKDYLDCYELDGTLLWRLDLGVNIRAGAHYTQFGVFDYDGDGKAELMVKTAPGTKMTRYEIGADGKNVLDAAGKPVAAKEEYVSIPEADQAEGVQNDSSYVFSFEEYREHLIGMFMDWGIWSSYSEETRKNAIEGQWSGNLVELFSVDERWGNSNFYTGESQSSANVTFAVADMTVDQIKTYIPEYQESDTLVNVCLRDEDGNILKAGSTPLLKTVRVQDVQSYYGNFDLESVNFDADSRGYTRDEAIVLADYYLEHGHYRMSKHDLHTYEGYIITGPEYISLFDCSDGRELDTQNWYYQREDDGLLWGDYANASNVEPGNRVDRFNVTVAYLDGETPSCVMGRGYYTRTTMAAYNVVNKKLQLAGAIDSGWTLIDNPFNGNVAVDGIDPQSGALAGEGNHQLEVADVDGDGCQEVINGGAIVSYKNSKMVLYSAGGDYKSNGEWAKYGHGDAMHITDIDPDRPGLEIASCFESGKWAPYNWAVREAENNTALFGVPGSSDFGRIIIGDILPGTRGLEVDTKVDCKGNSVSLTGVSNNMNIKWNADMTTQFVTGSRTDDVSVIGNVDGKAYTYFTAKGYRSNNDTKGNPALTADLFGDYREEIILRKADSTSLRIYMNTQVSEHKNYTLMQNLQYRAGIAGQNSAYNQPEYTDYYYAGDTDWEYVTVPNRSADQQPGRVEQQQAPALEGAEELSVLLLDDSAVSAGTSAKAWKKLEGAVNILGTKAGLFEDTSTPADFDMSLVNKMLDVLDAAEGVNGLDLLDTTQGDALYRQAMRKLANQDLYTEASIEILQKAMQTYDLAMVAADLTSELAQLAKTLNYWLEGVDLTTVEDVYNLYVDFDCVQTGGNAYNNSLPYLTPGWTSVGITQGNPYLTTYSEETGYGLLKGTSGRNRNSGDTLLSDWMGNAEFAVDLPAGNYQVAAFNGDLGGKGQTSYIFYKDYDEAAGSGTVLAKTSADSKPGNQTCTTTKFTFSLEKAARVTMVTGGKNSCTNALVIEQIIPAVSENYDTTELTNLLQTIDDAALTETDYTISSWKVFTDAYAAAKTAVSESEKGSLQELTAIYNNLKNAYLLLSLRTASVDLALDFGPENENGEPAKVDTSQKFGSSYGTITNGVTLGLGTMLYNNNMDDNGLHYGFTAQTASGYTATGGNYFRDWVYAEGGREFTFKADLPIGYYYVYVYTGCKENANVSKLYFNNGEAAAESANSAVEQDEEGRYIYTQESFAGGQFKDPDCIYKIKVTENEQALSTIKNEKIGTFSITMFNDDPTLAGDDITARMCGIELLFAEELKQEDIFGDITEGDVSGGDVSGGDISGSDAVLAGKTDLKDLIDRADRVKAEDYTTDSYNLLTEALNAAKEVYEDPQSIWVPVNEAAARLKAAMRGLAEKLPDTSGLSKALARAEQLEESAYTPAAYQELKSAIEAGYAVLNQQEAGRRAVNAAVASLNKALAALEERENTDKSALKRALDKAGEAGAQEKYTPATYAALTEAIQTGQVVYDNPEAAQPEVDAAVAALNKALRNLELRGDKEALKMIIAEAEGLHSNQYTAKSYAALTRALNDAVLIAEDENASQQEINEALTKLEEAVALLIESGDRNALKAAIDQARAVEESEFTADSYAVLRKALTDAESVYDNANAVKEEVDTVLEALQDALNSLVPVPDEPDTPDVPDEPDTPDVPDEPDTPVVPDVPDEPDIPDEPDTPVVPDEPDVPDVPDTPDVSDDSGQKGNQESSNEISADWGKITSDVKAKVQEAQKNQATGASPVLNIVTGEKIVVPDNVLNLLKGQKMTAAFHTGWGLAFSISGTDIPARFTAKDLNLSVRQGTGEIPVSILNQKISGTISHKKFSMTSQEELGITVNLHLNMGKEHAGKYANLYRYNKQSSSLEYMGSYTITQNGQAMFGIRKGADFLVTVTSNRPSETSVGSYTVVKGDTLSGIAWRYQVKIKDLLAANPDIKDAGRIYPGKIIQISR